jgi:opacity protein-like surface antigen
MKFIVATSLSLICNNGFSQDMDSLMNRIEVPLHPFVTATFKTTRLVNLHTIEQVKRGGLDFRISHRFDDAGGSGGGIQTFYGFDNVADIRFSFDYGITDWLAVGIARSKGAYLRRQIMDLNSKFRILRQKENGVPFSLSLYLASEVSTMPSSTDIYSTAYYGVDDRHRINYVSQVLIARKFGDRFSFELAPTVVHRNLVLYSQRNTSFALGGGLRYKFTRRMAVILDYYYNFQQKETTADGYQAPLGIGIEIETGGHVFHLLFSNNKSLLESQFLTENTANWLEGQFRFGFNISRVFHLN